MSLKLEHRRHARKRALPRCHAGDALPHADRAGQFLAMMRAKLRLVIQKVDVRRPAGHEQVDDALGLRRKVDGGKHAAGRRQLLEIGIEQ